MNLEDNHKGIISLFLAVVFFSLGAVLIRFLRPFFNQIELMFWRQLLVVAVLLIVILARKKKTFGNFNTDFVKYGLIVFLVGPMIFISALFFTSVANMLFLDSLYVVFNIILSDFMLGEKFSLREIMATLLGLFGAVVIFIPAINMSISRLETLGLVFGLLSGLFYSITIIYSRRLRRKYDTIDMQFWGIISSFVLLVPLMFIFGDPAGIFTVGLHIIEVFVFCTILTMLGGFYCLIYGTKHVRASLSGMILLIEAPLAAFIAFFILGEVPTFWTLVGGVIILLAGGIIVRNAHTPA